MEVLILRGMLVNHNQGKNRKWVSETRNSKIGIGKSKLKSRNSKIENRQKTKPWILSAEQGPSPERRIASLKRKSGSKLPQSKRSFLQEG